MSKNKGGNGIFHDIAHVNTVEQESLLKMGHAQKKWLIDYQQEREKKMLYIK